MSLGPTSSVFSITPRTAKTGSSTVPPTRGLWEVSRWGSERGDVYSQGGYLVWWVVRGGVKQKIDTVEIDDSKGYREQR